MVTDMYSVVRIFPSTHHALLQRATERQTKTVSNYGKSYPFVILVHALITLPRQGREHCDQYVCLCVCLSASTSMELLDRCLRNFVYRSPVAVVWSSSGGILLCTLCTSGLWMTSYLAAVGRMAMHGLSVMKYSAPTGIARLGRSLMSMNGLPFNCKHVSHVILDFTCHIEQLMRRDMMRQCCHKCILYL